MKYIPSPENASPSRLLFSLLMLAAGLFVFSGCALTRAITGGGGKLKKKVAVTVFEDRTRIPPEEIREGFQRQLAENMRRACSNILLITPEEKTFPDYLINLPRLPSGLINNFEAATIGRKYGYNAIVTGSFLEMKTEAESSGILWFKGTQGYVEPLVGVEVLDTETGAKILDERFSRKIKISEEELESLRSKEAQALTLLTKPLQEIADDVAEAVCDAINDQPWKGYIISVLTDKVILSSNENTGLVPGDVLEVYDSSSTIRGYGGQQFFLPGLKIGEIKITAVFPNRCEAVVVSGTGIKEGCAVKPR